MVVDEIDPETLLTNPSAVAAGKKTLVKQMTVKFSTAGSSGALTGSTANVTSSAASSTESVDQGSTKDGTNELVGGEEI